MISSPQHAERNMKFLGYSDQGGRPDGCQIMVENGVAYVGHLFSKGVSVIDVSNPQAPRPLNFLPVNPASWSIHLQTHGDLMLVAEEFDLSTLPDGEAKMRQYTRQGLDSRAFGRRGEDYSAGLRVYDISDAANPKSIAFMEVDGLGLHRLWWDGGRYAYASALLDGYTDHILIIIDLDKPSKPVEVGRWWLPGMWAAGGEALQTNSRVALHHAVVSGDTAYGSWRDAGITLLDVGDRQNPGLIAHRNWSPPFGGATHSALPLPDRNLLIVADEARDEPSREQMKHTFVLDIRHPGNPATIATLPTPSDQNYLTKGGQFGPHNLWENRPGKFVSSSIIFATYQNAGVRAFDLSNPFRPEELGFFVPGQSAASRKSEAGKGTLHSVDAFVDADGRVYVTDFFGGLHIAQCEF
ncbi:hypothetical protein [Mesorhizobium sp.]|uniref:LVIVD repeat-containing protein n=1 Tax=Mesorhizobium sp. TaxID=1871066 RepID=UPI00345A8597